MTVENARLFITKSVSDRQLRDILNAADTLDAIDAALADQGLPFTYAQFIEAHSKLLANSQSEDEAAMIRDIKTWWDFLLNSAAGNQHQPA